MDQCESRVTLRDFSERSNVYSNHWVSKEKQWKSNFVDELINYGYSLNLNTLGVK